MREMSVVKGAAVAGTSRTPSTSFNSKHAVAWRYMALELLASIARADLHASRAWRIPRDRRGGGEDQYTLLLVRLSWWVELCTLRHISIFK